MALSVSSTKAISGAATVGLTSPGKVQATPPQHTFRETLDAVMRSDAIFQSPLNAELSAFQQKVIQGQSFNAKELLYYQVRAGQFGLYVELYSKLADSMLAVTRRLQNPQ